jgi:hypothetical protein
LFLPRASAAKHRRASIRLDARLDGGLRIAQIAAFVERRFHAHDAGIVDQDVHARKVRDELLGETRDVGGIVYVERQGVHSRPIADRLLQRVHSSARDDDGVAEVVKAMSERLADPGAAAGDEYGVSCRLHG